MLFNPFSLATAIYPNLRNLPENEFMSSLSNSDLNYLNENDLFISKKSNAIAISNYFSNKEKYGRMLTISDAMTFACNMQCTYCFESNVKNCHTSLSVQNRIEEIKHLIDLYVNDIDYIDYVFFGGEPLIDLPYIETVAREISERYHEKHIIFSVTSNGTLVNNQFINICNHYQFNEIRITLDGPEIIHDSRRILKSGNSSYKLILKNIRKLCSETSVNVVINTVLDQANSNYYLNMFDEIENVLGEYIHSDYPQIIFNIGMMCHPKIDFSKANKENSESKNSGSIYYHLSKELINKNATITSPFYSAHCMNSSEKTFSLSPSGDIYKCVTGINTKRFLLATREDLLSSPCVLIKKNIYQIENSHRSQCKSCRFLIMCNGGCKFQHYENNAKLCPKDSLNNEMESLLDLLYVGEFTPEGHFRKRNI